MQLRQTKLLSLAVVILLLMPIVNSQNSTRPETPNNPPPSWYESWDDVRNTDRGIANSAWDSLVSTIAGRNEDASANGDIYGWYNGTFFGISSWEVDVCSVDLSSQIRNVRDMVQGDDGQDRIYTTTVTATAKRTQYVNVSFYEASWYIMPYDSDVEYRMYLVSGKDKVYFVGADNKFIPAMRTVGDAGYDVKYLDKNYDQIVLEYKYAGNTANDTYRFTARVVDTAESTTGTTGSPTGTSSPPGSTPPTGGNNPPSGSCPAPVTPKVDQINVHEHGRGWDATPIVIKNCDYCASIGMGTMGGSIRCSCPARPDGHPERPACESKMMGGNPRWFCNGNEIQASDNPYQASCSGSVKVCNADLSVCGQPN